MDNTAACSGFCRKKQKKKNKKKKEKEGQPRAGEEEVVIVERRKLFFLTSYLTLALLVSLPPSVEKKLEGIFSFFFSCSKRKERKGKADPVLPSTLTCPSLFSLPSLLLCQRDVHTAFTSFTHFHAHLMAFLPL